MRGGGRGRTALRIDEVGDDEPASRLSAQEWRAIQRERGVHRALGRALRCRMAIEYLVNTNMVDDPVYLQTPWMTAIHFKQERDGSKWDPTPCDARF